MSWNVWQNMSLTFISNWTIEPMIKNKLPFRRDLFYLTISLFEYVLIVHVMMFIVFITQCLAQAKCLKLVIVVDIAVYWIIWFLCVYNGFKIAMNIFKTFLFFLAEMS